MRDVREPDELIGAWTLVGGDWEPIGPDAPNDDG